MNAALAKPHYRALGAGEFMPASRMDIGDGFKGSIEPGSTPNKGAGWTRDIRDWMPRRGSADSDILRDLPNLLGRSRDIERNNGVATGIIRTISDNVVGTGLRLIPRPNYLALGKSKEWADAWALQVQSIWWQWAETTACHAGDTMTFDQITTQILRGQLLNGGALALPMWIPDRGDGYATKLQTVEIDRLSNPNGAMDTKTRRGGIDFGVYGEPLTYWVRDAHPGDALMLGAGMDMFTWTPIPRRTGFGRARVLHVFDPERSAQSRGKPLLSPVLPEFKNVDRYTMAELQAAVVNAMIALVIQTPMDQDAVMALFDGNYKSYVDSRDEHRVRLQAGGVLSLYPGDEAQSFLPNRPATAFGGFLEVMHRIIGLPADLPYELVMKDFSKTNYSSARAALLEAWRSFLRRRDWLGTQFADPTYDLFLEEQINAGNIEGKESFYKMRAAWTRCKWNGPGRGWVDPVKEGQGAQIRMASFLTTLEDECAEISGGDWREKLDQAAVERAYKISKGLPPDLVLNNIRAAQDKPTTDSSPDAGNPDATPEGDAATGNADARRAPLDASLSIYPPGNIALDTSGDEPLPHREANA